MHLFSIEHGKWAYRADFALYGAAMVGLGSFLLVAAPAQMRVPVAALVLGGLIGWTAIEYALHRFVLHGLRPFSTWHAEHHRRPVALICTPTLLSATLIAALVFVPAWMVGGLWRACALTLGVLAGYVAYAVTHHATHHWHADNDWSRKRKRWHALHHGSVARPGHFGVTSGFWDRVFGSHGA